MAFPCDVWTSLSLVRAGQCFHPPKLRQLVQFRALYNIRVQVSIDFRVSCKLIVCICVKFFKWSQAGKMTLLLR